MGPGEGMTRRGFLGAAAAAAAVLPAILALEGCGNAQEVLAELANVSQAVSGAITSLAVIPGAAAAVAIAQTYLTNVSVFAGQVSEELASTDSSAVKTQKIIAAAVGIAVPVIPSTAIQAIVAAVATTVSVLLGTLGVTIPQLQQARQTAAAPAPRVKYPRLSREQRAVALTIASQFAVYKLRLQTKRP